MPHAPYISPIGENINYSRSSRAHGRKSGSNKSCAKLKEQRGSARSTPLARYYRDKSRASAAAQLSYAARVICQGLTLFSPHPRAARRLPI